MMSMGSGSCELGGSATGTIPLGASSSRKENDKAAPAPPPSLNFYGDSPD